MLLCAPLFNCPFPVGQHPWADFDDAAQGTATERFSPYSIRIISNTRAEKNYTKSIKINEQNQPVILFVGVSTGKRRHAMTQHHVGKVKHLLNLEDSV